MRREIRICGRNKSACVDCFAPFWSRFFLPVGIFLIVFFAPFVAAPNAFRRLNLWLAKSRAIRAAAKARYGTDGTDQHASDGRIRLVCAVAVAIGIALLFIGVLTT